MLRLVKTKTRFIKCVIEVGIFEYESKTYGVEIKERKKYKVPNLKTKKRNASS